LIRKKYMNKLIVVFPAVITSLLSSTIWSQTDTLNISKASPVYWYFGSGFGACNRGGVLELSFTVTSSNFWGGSLNFRTNMSRSDNVPSDYYDDSKRVIPPKDYLSVLSLNLVKKFQTSNKYLRIGFEAGPSWVRYNLAEFEYNLDYDPDKEYSSWNWFLPNYMYYKSHDATSAIGLSLAAKTEFPFTRYLGLELSLYSIINNIQSVIGLDICVDLGRVGN